METAVQPHAQVFVRLENFNWNGWALENDLLCLVNIQEKFEITQRCFKNVDDNNS